MSVDDRPRAHAAGGIVIEVAAADRMLELERQRDVLAAVLVELADAGCSNGGPGCDFRQLARYDWCDECTAADALQRAGLR